MNRSPAKAKPEMLDPREVQILDAIQVDARISQRTLAGRLGVALGLINVTIKRLASKGYINIVKMDAQQFSYFVTPRGVAEKARRLMAHMSNTLEFYDMSRSLIRKSLEDLERTGVRRIAIYGVGDVAEMVFVVLRHVGLDLVCIADDLHTDKPWLGERVLRLKDMRGLRIDAVVLCMRNDLETPTLTAQDTGCPVWHLDRYGVPAP